MQHNGQVKRNKKQSYLKGYTVDEVYFKINENFDNSKTVKIDFDIDDNIEFDNESSQMSVELKLEVFKEMKKNNYPFSINVTLTGFFKTNGDNIEVFRPNAIAILYPYLRSIVSTYTANSNVSTLILPPINVVKYIESKKNKSKEQT